MTCDEEATNKLPSFYTKRAEKGLNSPAHSVSTRIREAARAGSCSHQALSHTRWRRCQFPRAPSVDSSLSSGDHRSAFRVLASSIDLRHDANREDLTSFGFFPIGYQITLSRFEDLFILC